MVEVVAEAADDAEGEEDDHEGDLDDVDFLFDLGDLVLNVAKITANKYPLFIMILDSVPQ